MNKQIDFQQLQQRKALDDWLVDCKRRMGLRFPKIDFDSDHWPINTLYKTEQRDWHFTEPMADFRDKDESYRDALRCLVAEMVITGKPKEFKARVNGFRLLSLISTSNLFDLTLHDLRNIEDNRLAHAKAHPESAGHAVGNLSILIKQIAQMGAKAVIPRFGFHVRAQVKKELRNILVAHQAKLGQGKGDLLDRKMEAFNDVFNAMLDDPHVDDKPILDPADRATICVLAILLCAPSRINEILCMSMDDHVTVEDYARRATGEQNVMHRAHQMLIITMKGSKGAQWGPKPALEFMIGVFHYCIGVLKELGKRSRMLIEWYQRNPNTLYLPPELEYLRGRPLSRRDTAKIMYLAETTTSLGQEGTVQRLYKELKVSVHLAPNPANRRSDGAINARAIEFLPWSAVEEHLLKNVHRAMNDCRRVTHLNHYEGDLSKMLFLLDREDLLYLPTSLNYVYLQQRLKGARAAKKKSDQKSIFEKLNITMPVNGKIQIAELDTHDPRRWLTTMALIHGETLSDVVINKWTQRCKLSQLPAYDKRTGENKAAASAMPTSDTVIELSDLSRGLAKIDELEDRLGLQTTIVTAHNAGIAMTSMDAVTDAIENRPVANSGQGLIIVYPQRYGICLHQHQETPCQNYSNDLVYSCIGCNEGCHVKGHIPTNDELRMAAKKVFTMVVRHLEKLALAHNRGVADDPDALGEHMVTLVNKGLSPETLQEFAAHLIDEFQRTGHLLKDRLLARRLEKALVLRELVKTLDNPGVASGALIKCINPSNHSNPLLEVALDANGGRKQIEHDERALIEKYPQFAPKALSLKDERHLIAPDDDENEED